MLQIPLCSNRCRATCVNLYDEQHVVFYEDVRAAQMSAIDLSQVKLENFSAFDFSTLSFPEDVLDKTSIHLDANTLAVISKEQTQIPASWEKIPGMPNRHIIFDGTVFKDMEGDLWVHGMYFENRKWNFSIFFYQSPHRFRDMVATIPL